MATVDGISCVTEVNSYVVLPQFLRGIISDTPRVKEAVDHSTVGATFGRPTDVDQYTIYEVQK